MLPDEPVNFRELCEKVGLALVMGQKVQFALAHYFSVYHMVHSKWSKQAKEKIDFHLLRPMGVVIASIEKAAPLSADLFSKVVLFRKLRNWLAHDFDEESTPFIYKGDKIVFYIAKMDDIINKGSDLMYKLHEVGESLVPVDLTK